jgi:hypothetical protein
MSNMSYCRFQNTLRDLQDCRHHFNIPNDCLSDEEAAARKALLELCIEILADRDGEDV